MCDILCFFSDVLDLGWGLVIVSLNTVNTQKWKRNQNLGQIEVVYTVNPKNKVFVDF